MKKIIEYLGTGPNPIDVPKLQTDKSIAKGDRVEAPEEIAGELEAQGLFAIVGNVDATPAATPQPLPMAPVQLLITNAMKKDLKMRGFNQEDIDKMTAEEAQKALA